MTTENENPKPEEESKSLLDKVKSVMPNKTSTPQNGIWSVETRTKKMEKKQKEIDKNVKQVLSRMDEMGDLFVSIEKSNKENKSFQEHQKNELLEENKRLRREQRAAALKIHDLRMNNRPFWSRQKMTFLFLFLTLVFGIISGYLQTNYDTVYSAWFFWFAVVSAVSTLIFVMATAFKRDDV